jgi:hypothetical protein
MLGGVTRTTRMITAAAAAAGLLLAAACGSTPAGMRLAARVAPAPAAGTAGTTGQAGTTAKARTWWHPTDRGPNGGPEFQWELDHALNVRSKSDMGLDAENELGKTSGKPAVYDIDGIDNPASTVTALHKMGDRVICYIEVGAAGNYYPASEEHLRVSYFDQLKADHDMGSAVPGYPEYYLDINAKSTMSIIKAMIRQQCAAKGFDAVEPDIDDSYTDSTGFRITEAENIRYDKTLGAYAHSLGLAWGQKNGDNDPAFSAALEPVTDFLLDEECNFYDTCSIVTPPYLNAGKLVLNAEYTDDWGPHVLTDLRKFCAYDLAHHIDGTLFSVALAGQRNPCR